jgi:hypothetical protein
MQQRSKGNRINSRSIYFHLVWNISQSFIFLLQVPSGLPRNLEAAVQRYGSATYKAPVATVLDPNGKLTITLTYGKALRIVNTAVTQCVSLTTLFQEVAVKGRTMNMLYNIIMRQINLVMTDTSCNGFVFVFHQSYVP